MSPLNLIAARQAAGLTVAELAAGLDVTPRAVRNWEAGTRQTPVEAFEYLGEFHARIAARAEQLRGDRGLADAADPVDRAALAFLQILERWDTLRS